MKSLVEKLSYEVTFESRMKGRRKVLDYVQQAPVWLKLSQSWTGHYTRQSNTWGAQAGTPQAGGRSRHAANLEIWGHSQLYVQ